MSGGLIKDYMEYLPVCYKSGIRPMLAQFTLMEGERERNLTSAHDQRFFLSAYNLKIDQFDCPTEQPFELNPEQRVGLLTHPAWLIAHSKNTETNPITRGKWVRERLLAGLVPDVPITVNAVVPEDPHKTLRERFALTRQAECWRCHKKMNPLGMTFEAYDDFGRFRTKDEASGKPIEASGPTRFDGRCTPGWRSGERDRTGRAAGEVRASAPIVRTARVSVLDGAQRDAQRFVDLDGGG